MGRRAKDPEIRKKEFVEAALELFQTKGFDQTFVTDITNKVGVSHGAFFYYYKSKDDILQDVIDACIAVDVRFVKGLIEDGKMTAKEKLKVILSTSVNSSRNRDQNRLAEFFHRAANARFHRDYTKRSREQIIPLLTEIVEQGIREGYCEIKYPKETILYLSYIFESIDDSFSMPQSNEEYYRKIRALEMIVVKSLGIKDDDLGLIDFMA
jgi:Transcriptional regulator